MCTFVLCCRRARLSHEWCFGRCTLCCEFGPLLRALQVLHLWDTRWQKERCTPSCARSCHLLVNSGTLRRLIPHLYGPHDLRKGCCDEAVNKTCCDLSRRLTQLLWQLTMGARLSTAAAISLTLVSSCDAFAPSPLLKGASRY